jgi:hypothetical protein
VTYFRNATDLELANVLVGRIKHGDFTPVALALVAAACISQGAEPAVDAAGRVIVPACENCAHFVLFKLARPTGECRNLDDMRVAPDFFCKHFEARK